MAETFGQDKKYLPIKKDDKFFSKLLSKEEAINKNASFRVYYEGAGGAIPFVWESTPGTPKHSLFSHDSLPPLTPPPSYFSKTSNSNNNTIMNKSMQKKGSKHGLIRSIFPYLAWKKSTNISPLSSSSSSSSSSYNSSFSTPTSVSSNKNYFLRRRWCSLSSIHFGEEEQRETFGSPISTLQFGSGNESHSRGCFRW